MMEISFVANRTVSVLKGVLTVLLGGCLLLWPGTTAGLIVKLIAAFLLAVGLITLVFALTSASKTGTGIPALVILNVAVFVVFGLLVYIFPNFFLSLIAFLFGAVLLFGGISQLLALYRSSKMVEVPGYLYLAPAAVTLCGIALFFSPGASTEVLTMIFGAAVLVFGVSELLAVWKLRRTEYADYEEIDR